MIRPKPIIKLKSVDSLAHCHGVKTATIEAPYPASIQAPQIITPKINNAMKPVIRMYFIAPDFKDAIE